MRCFQPLLDKNVCSFLSPSVSVPNEPLCWTAFSPAALPGQQQPPLNQHCLGHWGLESFPCCPSPPTTAFLKPHSCSFYSFAHICLCGKFTAHTACLNYLKAKYSRLCHKAFPFCVFYFSAWGPFMKSAAIGGRKSFAYLAPYTWNSLILGISKMSLIKSGGPR